MPELPDVEAFRKVLDSCAGGRTIQRVEVRDTGVLHGMSAARFSGELEGHRFEMSERHGKWLLARTDGPMLLVHFGMTGLFVCCRPDDSPHPHDRVVFTLDDDHQLRYRDQRKLKGMWLAGTQDVDRLLAGQGPDAAEIDREEFEQLLARRRGGVKSALIDQSNLAGLGNLLADEILWRAHVDPARKAGKLTERERGRLYTDMRRTVRSAVSAGRVPPRKSWLTGHRDERAATCPRCGERLRRGRVSGRSTVWCPHCQTG
ncbi:Fpg/Nei family DNA glycosylase [Streptomyces sp. NPDC059398]|uniref:Fpg/Nei family DNA glycosylase n=1 Tax=Streptomyces sp. NPDC059398 TaxID=3346820 RepID=UPI00368C2542